MVASCILWRAWSKNTWIKCDSLTPQWARSGRNTEMDAFQEGRWPKGFNYCDLHLGWLFLPPSWRLAQCASKRPSGTVCVSAKLQGRRCSPARSKATWRQCPEGARLVGQKDTWANTATGAQKVYIQKIYKDSEQTKKKRQQANRHIKRIRT